MPPLPPGVIPRCSDDRFRLELVDETYPCGDHYLGYAYRRKVTTSSPSAAPHLLRAPHISSSRTSEGGRGGGDSNEEEHTATAAATASPSTTTSGASLPSLTKKIVAIKDGCGKYTFENGSYYDGDWKQGYMEGHGVFYEGETGDSFDGLWSRGLRVEGAYRFSNGDIYIGAFDAETGSLKVGPAIVLEDGRLYSAIYQKDSPKSKRPLSFVNKDSWEELISSSVLASISMSASSRRGSTSVQQSSSSPPGSPTSGHRRSSVSPSLVELMKGSFNSKGGGDMMNHEGPSPSTSSRRGTLQLPPTSVPSTTPPFLPEADEEGHDIRRSRASPPPLPSPPVVDRNEEADARHFVNHGGMNPDRLDLYEAMEAAKVVLRMKREKASRNMQQRSQFVGKDDANAFTRDEGSGGGGAYSATASKSASFVDNNSRSRSRPPDNYVPSQPRALSTACSVSDGVPFIVPTHHQRGEAASSPVRQQVCRESHSGALDNPSFGALQRGQVEDFSSGPSTKELDIVYRFYR